MMAVMASDKQEKSRTPRPQEWKPGQSGNPGGRPRNEDSLAAQLREVLAEVDEESGKTKARLLAEKYVALGLDGNVMAITAIADRVDGKPPHSVTLKGDTDAPLHVRHSERLPAPSANGSPAPSASD